MASVIVYLGLLLSATDLIAAQATAWAQCGGIGWAGATTCVAGYTCTESSAYYSQCIPSTATDVPSGGTASATSTSPMATGSQIRTVQDPVFHYYLQNIGGAPKLGPESSSGYFTIGSMITLNSDDGSSLYLNVNTSATTSYKPLSLDATATTTDWGLEGDTIITTNPRQLNFIACPTSNTTVYDVYLQNGNDTPAGTTCTLVTMHLPCLC